MSISTPNIAPMNVDAIDASLRADCEEPEDFPHMLHCLSDRFVDGCSVLLERALPIVYGLVD